jgi:hypothetical protein
LLDRVYMENFLKGKLPHPEVSGFLVPKARRIGSLLPPTADGRELMEEIVTALTMTSHNSEHAAYNRWGDDIFAAAIGRAETEAS